MNLWLLCQLTKMITSEVFGLENDTDYFGLLLILLSVKIRRFNFSEK